MGTDERRRIHKGAEAVATGHSGGFAPLGRAGFQKRFQVNHFPGTEKKLLSVLLDGELHTPQELISKCMDNMSSLQSLRFQLYNIKSKLEPKGFLLCYVVEAGHRISAGISPQPH